MIRALWDAAGWNREPLDFKKDPYDLGSFYEIAHYRGGRGGRATTFEAGFNVAPKATRGKRRQAGANVQPYRFEVTFKKKRDRAWPRENTVFSRERLGRDLSRRPVLADQLRNTEGVLEVFQ